MHRLITDFECRFTKGKPQSCDHLPLYRQSDIFAREGVAIARSIMADRVGRASALMAPLIEALQAHVFAGDRLHGDDTPVPVLEPGRGRTREGRL